MAVQTLSNSISKNGHPLKSVESVVAQSADSLLYTLQTTLDINQLQTIFFQQLNKLMPCSGIIYCNLAHHLYLVQGSEKNPQCTYDLTLESETLGEITFCSKDGFNAGQQRTLENLLAALVLPMRNAIHYKAALREASVDPLTGLRNRRAFDAQLQREMSLSRRNATPLSLLVIDVDKFKRINDEIGHLAGDLALAKIGEALCQSVRESDLVFRYAGDEFVLLLPGMDATASKIIIQRIKKNIADCNCQYAGQKINMTVSVGAAMLTAAHDEQSFFDTADMDMFSEKTQH